PEIESVYETHRDSGQVRLAIARYASKLDKNYGGNLIKTLTAADDPQIKFLMHMRNLRVGKDKQVSADVFSATLAGTLNRENDAQNLNGIIDEMSFIDDEANNSTEILRDLLNIFRKEATNKGFTFVASDIFNSDDSFFGFMAESRRVSID